MHKGGGEGAAGVMLTKKIVYCTEYVQNVGLGIYHDNQQPTTTKGGKGSDSDIHMYIHDILLSTMSGII